MCVNTTVVVHIKGHKVLDDKGIRYAEITAGSLRQGFTIAIADSSHQVKGFLLNYEENNGAKELPISGSKVTVRNAAFIKAIRPGDQLSLECINIQKANVASLSTNFRIIVTD